MFDNVIQCCGYVIYIGHEIDFQIIPNLAPNPTLQQDV
jgi:hypothetical protein